MNIPVPSCEYGKSIKNQYNTKENSCPLGQVGLERGLEGETVAVDVLQEKCLAEAGVGNANRKPCEQICDSY